MGVGAPDTRSLRCVGGVRAERDPGCDLWFVPHDKVVPYYATFGLT